MSSRPRLGALLVAALAAAVVTACNRSDGVRDEDLAGLVVAPVKPAPIDVAKAGRDSAELLRAVSQPWTHAASALGDHELTIESKVEVKEGTAVLETLTEKTRLVIAKDGTYQAVYENSADYGREVVFVGGALYMRPRYARWHRRAPEAPGEPAAIRDQLAAVLAADLDLVAHGTEISDRGAAQEAGRSGRRLELKLDPSPRPAPKPKLTQQAWRGSLTVEAVTGELVLDEQLAMPLRGRLDATAAFVREGKRLTMHVTCTHAVAPIAAPTIAAPPDDAVVATPERAREVDDRNRLLQGIAPPVRKAPIPGEAPPPAPPESTPANPGGKP